MTRSGVVSSLYLNSLRQFVRSESVLQIRSRWVFPGPFNVDICTVNWTAETKGIQREKAALNPLVSS